MDSLISLAGAPVNAITLIIVLGMLFMQLLEKGLLRIGRKEVIREVVRKGRKERDHQVQIDAITMDVNNLKKDIKEIKENHLAHIQDDMTRLREDVSFIKGKLSK